MTSLKRTCFAPLAAALALLAFTVGCDREEKPSSPAPAAPAPAPGKAQSRMDDPAYREQLKGMVAEQGKVAKTIAEIERKMEHQRSRARAALPKGATDEQVRKELESNPEKYPDWKYLVIRREAAEKARQKRRDEAYAAVRARIAQEAAASAALPGKAEKK